VRPKKRRSRRAPFRARPETPAAALEVPRQGLVPAWLKLLQSAESAGTLQTAEPEPGVVLFAWYYDKFAVNELGEGARDREALLSYQPKLRMRERAADGARKEKMKKLASDYYFRYRMYRLEAGAEHRAVHPRFFLTWDLPIEAKKWIHNEVVKGYVYVDRERLIKRLYDRLGEEGYGKATPVPKADRSNRIRARAAEGEAITVNITRALEAVGYEGLGFEESIEVEIARARGGRLPAFEAPIVELRRLIEGDEFVENEGLWAEHGPPALRAAQFALVRSAAATGKRQVEDRGQVVFFAYPISRGSARERRECFFDAIRYIRENHRSQLRGRFFQFAPSAEPPEDLYVTHVVNEWVDDKVARAEVDAGRVFCAEWIDSRAMAQEVLEGFGRIGVHASTGRRTAELRQRVLLIDGATRRPFELGYGAQLSAQFGYSFEQAVDLSIIKAFLKVEGE